MEYAIIMAMFALSAKALHEIRKRKIHLKKKRNES